MGSPRVFSEVFVARSLVFFVMYCRSFFVFFFFIMTIVLFALLPFAASDYRLISSNFTLQCFSLKKKAELKPTPSLCIKRYILRVIFAFNQSCYL